MFQRGLTDGQVLARLRAPDQSGIQPKTLLGYQMVFTGLLCADAAGPGIFIVRAIQAPGVPFAVPW